MNNKATITIIIILVVAVGILLAWYFLGNTNTETNTNANNAVVATSREVPPAHTVWIMEGSFTPSVMNISAGETITWINKDAIVRVVASDPHPAHTDLPELLSDTLEQDGMYSFTFTEAGTYGYHDDLNPIKKGQIVVE